MAQKEHSHFNLVLFSTALIFFISCTSTNNEKKDEVITASSFFVDTALIPNDTVLSTKKSLALNNGIYFLNNGVYSGYIKMLYPNDSLNMIGGILNGMLHDRSISFYPDGKTRDIRMYKENKSCGRQIGFWENGNPKFEFYYLDDKREGSNKQWYHSGQPYAFLNFKDDKENGMQQAWRENGKPYINNEARDGYRYGLQKSSLCYTLQKEKFITSSK